MAGPPPDITTLLGLASRGDRAAQDQLYRRVEAELRKSADAFLRREGGPHGFQATLLIDEAFVRLVGGAQDWADRRAFYGCAARVMRELLVDDARRRAATKRGGGVPLVSLESVPDPAARSETDPLTLLALNEALDKLAAEHPDLIRIVELHHFGGWDLKQIAEEILHVSYATVKRGWRQAKALLHREMSEAGDDP